MGNCEIFVCLWGLLYGLSLLSFSLFFFVFVTCYEIMILNIIQYEMEIFFFVFA